ncbi:MAG: hypothetical protein OQL09_10750 [Gammaproteobacteria bacterium]|nr:hypothetical protein [Gammaproteobacteria bacterium]
MTEAIDRKSNLKVAGLIGVVLVVMAAMYFTPIWWVSLKAPNYPPEAFPDGIRIHFHFNGVFNGCTKRVVKELHEEEALNCVHEMDVINHYVGMYPIASGGPIERVLSQFLVAFLGVMLVGFACRKKKLRAIIMSVGFGAIAVWMATAMYTEGGVMMISDGYRASLQDTLDLDVVDIENWSGIEAVTKTYSDTLGIFFREREVIAGKVATLEIWTNGIVIALIAAMVLLVVGSYFSRWFYWLLILVPILLPVFFVIDYAAWLWYFGHTLNDMGAFTVKPFMPTVFGQGKVAQFSTHSYPYIGFFMMMFMSALLGVAAVIRHRQFEAEEG